MDQLSVIWPTLRALALSLGILIIPGMTDLSITTSTDAYAHNTTTAIWAGGGRSPWTWTGAGGNSLWSNGANWCGQVVSGVCQGQSGPPPATATVSFNGSVCSTNCNVTLDMNVSVYGWRMNGNYSGTITQGAHSITLNGGQWIQRAGTFSGGTGAITLEPITASSDDIPLFVSVGGTFTSTSGLTTVKGGVSITSVAVFSGNGGRLRVEAQRSNTTLNFNGGTALNHVDLVGLSSNYTSFNVGNFSLGGDLTIGGGSASNNFQLYNGTITLSSGSLYLTGHNVSGTTLIDFKGSGLQLIDVTGATLPRVPSVRFSSTSVANVVRLVADTTFWGDFTNQTMGNVDLNGKTPTFGVWDFALNVNPGALSFENLIISRLSGTASTINWTGTTTVNGTLTLSGNEGNSIALLGGTFELKGNLNVLAWGAKGTTTTSPSTINFSGSAAQSITTNGTIPQVPTVRYVGAGPYTISNSNGAILFQGNFEHVSGTFTAPSAVQFGTDGRTTNTIRTNGISFENVTVRGSAGTATLLDDMIVQGELVSMSGTSNNFNGSRFLVRGAGYRINNGANGFAGTSIIRLEGAGSQTVHTTLGVDVQAPGMEIASTGTVTFNGAIDFDDHLSYVSGTVAFGTGLFRFNSSRAGQTISGFTSTHVFPRITLQGGVKNLSGQLVISVAFIANSSISGGAVEVRGNVSLGGSQSGSSPLSLTGSSSTLNHGGAVVQVGSITIAKDSGQSVTLVQNLTMNGSKNLQINSGSLNLAGFNATVTGALTLASGTSITMNGGSLTVGGSAVPAGPYSNGTIVP